MANPVLEKIRGWFARKRLVVLIFAAIGLGSVAIGWLAHMPVNAVDAGKLGGPLPGLTAVQLQKFYQAKEIFKKDFTVEEGLGPMFNAKSCFDCHGRPGISGGEGRDKTSTSILMFARRVVGSEKASKPIREVIQGLRKPDVDFFLDRGGPTLQRRTITSEFPDKFPFQFELDTEQLPVEAEIISLRHSPAVFGDGLIDMIPDGDMMANVFDQTLHAPHLRGRAISAIDRFMESARASRFGWKDQHVNLMNFTANAMNVEMGITSYLHHTEHTPTYLGIMADDMVKRLPQGVNDRGKVLLSLVYYQSLLAPPPRAEITEEVKRGEEIFKKLECAVCHKPDARTIAKAEIPDPESPLPHIKYTPIEALSDKIFHPYSDFLVHDMGVDLADGIPQEGAKGGEWRTTPLWGLRLKKFLLHDGRTRDIHEAIMLHGGQAASVRDRYAALPEAERASLLSFMKSL